MPTVAVKGQELFYAHHKGPHSTAPTVILIHGAGGSRLEWPAELRRLPGATVYDLDLPGHGRSEPPGRDSIGAYADVVITFAHALGLEDVFLVGHSMGGAIAQTIGLRPPPSLRGLVLVSTGARLRVTGAILGRIREEFTAAVDTIAAYAWSPAAPPALVEAGRALTRQNDPAVLYDDYVACNAFDLIGKLDQIALPALVVGGTADQMTPPKYSHYLAEQLPNARLELIAGAGHMVALEQPQAVAGAIVRFVHEITGT